MFKKIVLGTLAAHLVVVVGLMIAIPKTSDVAFTDLLPPIPERVRVQVVGEIAADGQVAVFAETKVSPFEVWPRVSLFGR